MNGMTAIREHAGVSGFKRPYSDMDNDLSYSGRYSRSRLDYDPQVLSRVGNDPEVGYGAGIRRGGIYDIAATDIRYGAGSRGGRIYSSDYVPSGTQYPSVLHRNATGVYGYGRGSASFY